MSDIRPPEDDITKSQLWDRIDSTRAAIESHKGEIMTRMDILEGVIKSEVSGINSEQNLLTQRKISDMLDNVKNYNIDMAKKVDNVADEIKSLFQSHLAKVDQDLKNTRTYIEQAVKSEAMSLFSDDQKEIAILKESYKKFHDGMNKSLANHQLLYQEKIGSLNTTVERVISKLKDWFQDL